MHMTMIKTDTYYIKDTYLVDLVTNDVTYEAFIYNENYGIKIFMFGVDNLKTSYEEFKTMIENNVDEYINYYKEDIEEPENKI